MTDEQLRAWADGEAGVAIRRVMRERDEATKKIDALREALAREFEARRERHDRLAKEAKTEALEATDEEARRGHESRVDRFDAIVGAYAEAARVVYETDP
jgi:hypothetical protein